MGKSKNALKKNGPSKLLGGPFSTLHIQDIVGRTPINYTANICYKFREVFSSGVMLHKEQIDSVSKKVDIAWDKESNCLGKNLPV
jgi:hypothetical protein